MYVGQIRELKFAGWEIPVTFYIQIVSISWFSIALKVSIRTYAIFVDLVLH